MQAECKTELPRCLCTEAHGWWTSVDKLVLARLRQRVKELEEKVASLEKELAVAGDQNVVPGKV